MESSGDRKQRIVEAAFRVAMTRGVQDLRFDVVAKQAGLSRQLLRYYFDSPEALMIALCDHLAGAYRQALVSGAARVDDKKRLDFFFDFFFDMLEDQPKPRDDQAYDAMFAVATGNPAVRKNLHGQYGLVGHVLSHELQVSHPDLATQDCLELSYLFVCVMYGHWKMVATLGYNEDHRYVARRAIDRLLQSYLRKTHAALGVVRPWS